MLLPRAYLLLYSPCRRRRRRHASSSTFNHSTVSMLIRWLCGGARRLRIFEVPITKRDGPASTSSDYLITLLAYVSLLSARVQTHMYIHAYLYKDNMHMYVDTDTDSTDLINVSWLLLLT